MNNATVKLVYPFEDLLSLVLSMCLKEELYHVVILFHVLVNYTVLYFCLFVFVFWFFETGFFCIAPAVLELTL